MWGGFVSDTGAEGPRKPIVQMHDSGLAATHDMACAVCRVEKAVLQLNRGYFGPCWKCQGVGWLLHKRRWWEFWL